MRCKHCNQELPENAKFCTNCGAKVEVENIEQEPVVEEVIPYAQPVVNENPVEEEKVVEEPVVDNGVKEWYFVENNASNGPFTQMEMLGFISAGRLNNSTFVWKEGMSNWTHLEESPLKSVGTTGQKVEEKVVVEEVKEEEKEWYYILNENQQQGPVTLSTMVDLIKSKSINGNTYVWKNGMGDWEHLKNTALARYLNASSNTSNQTYANNPMGGAVAGIVKKNIVTCILLSIVTCGLYSLYWLYCMAEDVNKILRSQGRQELSSGGMLILLSIVTCGIYGIYYFYKVGKTLGELQFSNGYRPNDDSLVMMLLCIFQLGIVSYCILQNTINEINDYASL